MLPRRRPPRRGEPRRAHRPHPARRRAASTASHLVAAAKTRSSPAPTPCSRAKGCRRKTTKSRRRRRRSAATAPCSSSPTAAAASTAGTGCASSRTGATPLLSWRRQARTKGSNGLPARTSPRSSAASERVDLRAALETLAASHDVQRGARRQRRRAQRSSRARGPGATRSACSSSPCSSGGVTPRTFLRGPDPSTPYDVAKLHLAGGRAVRRRPGLARYDVEK